MIDESNVAADNQEEIAAPAKPSLFSKTTLGELGAKLPVYCLGKDKKPIQDLSFSFHTWDMEMEEKLAERAEKSKNVGLFINEMMCMLLDQFCGQDFQAIDGANKTLMMNQLDMSNMMYLYIFLRVEVMGADYRLSIVCPNGRCGKQIDDYVVSLEDVDVHVKEFDFEKGEPKNPRVAKYELVKPILFNDMTITAFEFDVSKWDYMERSEKSDGDNTASLKKLMLKSSISGFYTGTLKVTKFLDPQAVMKKLQKVDIEKCIRMVTENNAGPAPVLAGECPHCKTKWHKPLDWSYRGFFDSSSL